MRHTPKGAEPAGLMRHRQVPGASYEGPGFPHQEIRDTLVRDQRGLCCFCMGRIRAEADKMKVAHFVPRSVDRSLEIAWSNLLGACLGVVDAADRRPANQTCDTRQGDQRLSIDPRNAAISSQIEYSSGDGRISIARSGCHESAYESLQRDIDVTLNLNHRMLCKARTEALHAAISELQRQKPKGTWERDWLARRLRCWSEGTTLPPYFGIIERYLNKHIARGTS